MERSVSDALAIRRSVCPHDCPDACGLLLTVNERTGRLVSVAGDPEHPFTQGLLCGKVDHYEERVNASSRVLYPLRRTGPKGSGTFERIQWEEAYSEIVERTRDILDTSGGEAILPYSYAGTMGEIQERAGYAFFRLLGASELDRTICDSAATAGWNAALPGVPGTDPERVSGSDLVLIWGMNAAFTNLHFFRLVRRAQRSGTRLIVVDPTRTHTAQAADVHLSPRPGTDTALVLGLLAVLWQEGRLDEAYLRTHTDGWDRMTTEVLPAWSAERAAQDTGLPEEAIRDLAHSLAAARAPFIRIGVGIGRHPNGSMMVRAIASLAVALQAFAKPGGGCLLFTEMPPLHREVMMRPDLLNRPTPRTVNMIELGDALTRLANPIRALFVYDSNPANVAPDQSLVRKGLSRPDLFTVVHEQFLTDTARYADLVLPATMMTEHTDLYHSYGHTYLRLGMAASRPRGEAVSNWTLFRTLALRMGFTDPMLSQTEEDLIPRLVRRQSAGDPRGLTDAAYEALLRGEAVPIGTVQGDPLEPRTPAQAHRRLRWFVPAWEAERGDGLLTYTPYRPLGQEDADADASTSERVGTSGADHPATPGSTGPWLHLLTAPGSLYLNTTFQPVERLRRREGPPSLLVSPEDAAASGVTDGAWVEAQNGFGASRFVLRVSDRARPGTAIAAGVHDDRGHAAPGLAGSGSLPGPSLGVNALTSQTRADHGRGPVFYGHAIRIRPLPQDTPPAQVPPATREQNGAKAATMERPSSL